MTDPAGSAARSQELEDSLRALHARIAAACASAGRDPAEVTVIAVTKTFPAADVALLSQLGVTDMGENRDQEAAPKAAACAAAGLRLRWHFVGQLQVNKAASVASYADVVHSVDRQRLVAALSARASTAGRTVTCLIQVNLDDIPINDQDVVRAASARTAASAPAPGRGGASVAQVPALAAAVAAADGLELGGVMAIAPHDAPARPAFERLRQAADALRREYPAAWMISAGMSGDLEEAIAAGATHVRVGTALLGGRRAFVR